MPNIKRTSLAGSLLAALFVTTGSLFAQSADELEKGFVEPPASAKPHTWWHWMNGNITKEGITADLEAMANIGIGGAQIFNVSAGIPQGPVLFNSPEWRDMVKYAAQEADRLGMELGIHNCGGWSSSGGPWNTPEHGMQIVVTSEKKVHGPLHFEDVLPQPPTKMDCYHDIAVLAFRTPPSEEVQMKDLSPKITAADEKVDGEKLIDGRNETGIAIPPPTPSKPAFIQVEFASPFTARLLTLRPAAEMQGCTGRIEVSDDGKNFREIKPFSIGLYAAKKTFAFDPVSAHFFRVVFTGVHSGTKQLKIVEMDFSPRSGIEGLSAKTFVERDEKGLHQTGTLTAPDETVPHAQIVNLTGQTVSGKLVWDVPEGDWTILRLGHTPTGSTNEPSPQEGVGLECDKLSKEATGAHWEGMMSPLLKDLGPLAGKSLNNVLIDSYEVGSQNWTPEFQEEFKKRRDYDLTPFLPALTGRIVDNREVTERFLWDFRRTVADLFAENYSETFAELAHKNGLLYSVEPYGNCPSDCLQYGSYADIPMTEFWPSNSVPDGGCAVLPASLAHIYGRKFVGAEAFTASPENGKWTKDPFSLKALGDCIWCGGVNRFIFHRYAMQPWTHPTRYPGMTMGPWGTHFERTLTWWEQGRAWMKYLARGQYLLQQGLFVADVCFFNGENAPSVLANISSLPKGFKFDVCDTAALDLMSVKDGRIVLPDGMSYRLLALPSNPTVTLETFRKIKKLADAGAVIVGKKPACSPGLSGYPGCDAEVVRLAAETNIVTDKSPAEFLASLKIPPDFKTNPSSVRIPYIHRTVRDIDIYFVSNQENHHAALEATFRISGKTPELWHPDTGQIEQAPVWHEENGCTTLPLSFDPAGSVFVVFRKPAVPDHIVSAKFSGSSSTPSSPEDLTILNARFETPPYELAVNPDGRTEFLASQSGKIEAKTSSGKTLSAEIPDVPHPLEITGPWQLNFPPNWGAPAQVTLPELISWTDHPDCGVKYFSGTASYVKDVDIPKEMFGTANSLWLDLGDLKNLAEVSVNGKPLGILWKPPFCVDITKAAKPGKNTLEIKITNLWPNRLIGDEQLPPDCEWNANRSLKEWPQWLLEGKSSPTGRYTFATWHHWTKDDKPLPSGLLGPVTVSSKIGKLLK